MAVPATSRPKLAALDSNVLFHLAEQHAPSHNLVRRLVRSGFTPIVTQTVVQELGFASMHGETDRKRAGATMALSTMREWGIQPVSLKPVGNGMCVTSSTEASRPETLVANVPSRCEGREAFSKSRRPSSGLAVLLRVGPRRCPFANLPMDRRVQFDEGIRAADLADYRWVHPVHVVQLEFQEWTRARLLRHSRFLGLRDDKRPRECCRE